MSERENSQRERGATRADRTAPAPAGPTEERAQTGPFPSPSPISRLGTATRSPRGDGE
jgi:hypothetical protein